MRRLIHFFAICLVVSQLISCKKEVANPSSTPITASAVAGNFTVGSFVSSNDQTSVFNGFAFTFNENGTIVATKGSNTFNGTWRFDDSNNTEIKISFSTAPLNDLNGSWHINELNDDHLSLSSGEAENDDDSSHHSSLEFERD